MEKLDLTTPNFTDENIAKLAELFPNCVTETKGEDGKVKRAIDFDALRQEFSETIVEGPVERYSLNWPGKREALVTANTPISKTLRPCREESVDFDTTKNIFIEGDNLDALKLLQETYLDKIKMIYIDPPYNTGNDFIYNDNFTADKDEYDEASGQRDEEGGRLVANPDSNGRYHSDWLSMMYPRLKLARNLLKEDGVIFISIDNNEQANLKRLCDEVFGEENFVGLLAVENNPKGRKNSRFVSVSNDYCLIYAKNKEISFFIENIPKSAGDMKEDEDGNFVHNSGKRVLVGENSFNKEVKNFKSEKHYSVYYNGQNNHILLEQESSLELENKNLISKGFKRYTSSRDGSFIENTYTKSKLLELSETGALEFKEDKIFEKNFSSSIRIKSVLTNKEYEAVVNGQKINFKLDVKTTSAGTDIKELFGTKDSVFPAPKNVGLLKTLITLFDENDLLVLDFFSGSGTTAHAVMQLNTEDGGNRQCISVQLPEEADEKSEAFKAGYKNIAEISKERIHRAGKKIKEENANKKGIENLDVGFRVLKIDSSNMQDVHLSPDETKPNMLAALEGNIKSDRTSEDLLFQVLLDWGVDLSLPIENQTIDGKTVYFVDNNALAACFDEGINEDFVKELAAKQPLRVVFRDDGFASDSVKINVEQIFKLKSPSTDIRVI